MSVLLVLCTCPDEAMAQTLAHALVEQHLAACVNLIPRLRSIYRWQGRIECSDEVLLLIKTVAERFEAVRDHIVGAHPYALPEVLAFESIAGLDRYLDWVRTETKQPGESE
jgi:periplasmic divalent cation tolerance protein